jgi:50S ribosomal protein L16 3-hydroxylase
MRAPSAADLTQAFGEWLAARPDEGGRFRDPGLKTASRSGEIETDAIDRLLEIIRFPNIQPEEFAAFVGEFLSRYRLAHEPAAPARKFEPSGLVKELERGLVLSQNPWTRLYWTESQNGARLFAAGTEFSCSLSSAMTICDADRLRLAGKDLPGLDPHLVCELLNRGHLYLERL